MVDGDDKQQEERDLFAPESDHFGSKKSEKKKKTGFLSFLKRRSDSDSAVPVTNPWDTDPVSDPLHEQSREIGDPKQPDTPADDKDARTPPGFWNTPMAGPADEEESKASGSVKAGEVPSYEEMMVMPDQEKRIPAGDDIAPGEGGEETDVPKPDPDLHDEIPEIPSPEDVREPVLEEEIPVEEIENPAETGIDSTQPDVDMPARPVPLPDRAEETMPDAPVYPMKTVSPTEESVLSFETEDPVSASAPKD